MLPKYLPQNYTKFMCFIGLTRHCYTSYTLTNSSNTRCNILFSFKKRKDHDREYSIGLLFNKRNYFKSVGPNSFDL